MMKDKHQTGGEGSTNIQAESVTTNNNHYNTPSELSPEDDLGILNEIVDYIFGRIPEINVRTVNNRGDSTTIVKKIGLNFRSEEERITITESFHRNWIRKSLVEEFIAIENEVNPYKVDALIDKIQSDFRKLKHSGHSRAEVENNEIIQELAINYLPLHKRKNPEYVANAKAIVLYLFELCYFGKVTAEQQKTLDNYLNSPEW